MIWEGSLFTEKCHKCSTALSGGKVHKAAYLEGELAKPVVFPARPLVDRRELPRPSCSVFKHHLGSNRSYNVSRCLEWSEAWDVISDLS